RNIISQYIQYPGALTGLFQFSVENASRVKVVTPNFLADLAILITFSAPSLCPKVLGLFCFLAHLPFPSRIMAMWFGIFNSVIIPLYILTTIPKGGLIFYKILGL